LGVINYFYNNILLKRLFSSIILIFFALYLNNKGGIFFFIATFFALVVLSIELYKIFDIKIYQPIFFKNILFYATFFILIYLNLYSFFFIAYAFGFIVSFLILKHKYSFILLSYTYILLPLILLLLLSKSDHGKIIIYWMFIVVWTTDISGYFFGKLIGGPKLFPAVSPNKTWSGLIFGVIISGLGSILFSYFLGFGGYINFFIMGSLGAIITTAGDLFESKLKRMNNKKDASNFIPGHGGLLDRLDGFLFAILYFYILSLL